MKRVKRPTKRDKREPIGARVARELELGRSVIDGRTVLLARWFYEGLAFESYIGPPMPKPVHRISGGHGAAQEDAQALFEASKAVVERTRHQHAEIFDVLDQKLWVSRHQLLGPQDAPA